MRAREPASFWSKKVIVVVILLRVLARMSCQRTQVIKCYRSNYFAAESLTSFNKENIANLFGEIDVQ